MLFVYILQFKFDSTHLDQPKFLSDSQRCKLVRKSTRWSVHSTGSCCSWFFTTLKQCFHSLYTDYCNRKKCHNDVLWGRVFNFLFSSLCVPCRHCSDKVGVRNGSAGNDLGTSTIKLDELLAPTK